MDLHPEDFPEIISCLDQKAESEGYTKIFAKVPARFYPSFVNAGYASEAWIPGFYNDREDVFLLAKYFSLSRKLPEKEAMERFQQFLLTASASPASDLPKGYSLKALAEEDVCAMTILFKEVFESYPFPIFDPDFIVKSMKEDDTRYFGAYHSGVLVGISSAEYQKKYQHAEMTDFAVSQQHRGKRLAVHLLKFMEQELSIMGCQTFFTIARLHSLPMNKTFMSMGYRYSGTMINNTQISGNIESMNIWYKKCSKRH